MGTSSTIALIVAAGRGVRMGGDLPKQYMEMAGRPVLAHTMKAFAEHPGVEKVRAVIHPNDMGLYQSSAQGLDVLDPVPGGPSLSNRCCWVWKA